MAAIVVVHIGDRWAFSDNPAKKAEGLCLWAIATLVLAIAVNAAGWDMDFVGISHRTLAAIIAFVAVFCSSLSAIYLGVALRERQEHSKK